MSYVVGKIDERSTVHNVYNTRDETECTMSAELIRKYITWTENETQALTHRAISLTF